MASARSWSSSGRGSRAEAGAGRRAFLGGLAAALAGVVSHPSPARPASRVPRIAAHRGGALLWPENSLTAFRGALALGVDLVELDVHLSRDDEVVVIHDPTLERTTSGQGPVRGQPWDALARLTLRQTAAEPVPRLAEVLDLLRPTPVGLLLEIKVDAAGVPYPGIEERVLTHLRGAGLAERTAVMAFHWDTLDRLRRLDPRLRLTGLLGQRGAPRVGGVPGAVEQLRALAVDDLGIERTLLSPAAVAAARAAGRTIGVWTVNEADELRTVLASGVDYVTTDRPDLALRLRAPA